MIEMKMIHMAALGVMAAFYAAYFLKMLRQRRKGVQTDQIGKGKKAKRLLVIERLMKAATHAIVPVEIISIVCDLRIWDDPIRWGGIAMAALGVAVFVIAMQTMKDSWRAGIAQEDKTELVTTGIYRISRNPAFLGFDLMYIGLLIAFFNIVHFAFAVFAVVMLHLQIRQEEVFLTSVFGAQYTEYKERTGRYFILF